MDQANNYDSPEHIEFERIEENNLKIEEPRIFQLLKQVNLILFGLI